MHRKITLLFLCCSLMMCRLAFGAQHQYSKGTIVEVQQRTRNRVDLYLVNTPVSTEVAYFEITVQSANIKYVAEYTPRHSAEVLSTDWITGAEVSIRPEKHYLFLKRTDGSEVQWTIVKRIRADEKAN